MHKMLQRQLKQAREKSGTGELDVDRLLELIDAAYVEVDRERRYTTHAHQVMRDEQAELLRRQMQTTEAMARIAAEKAEAERAQAAAEAALLKQERMSLLGRLMASVAHELRNPLSTIRNTLNAIHQIAREKGVAIDRQMSRIERTIDRCDGIIDDLLDYAGSPDLNLSPLSLDTWLGEVLDKQRLPDSITLERRMAAPGAMVPIDTERLRLAIGNLIENAAEAIVDAPDLAERRITVSTHVGASAEIVIADTGPGMSESVLARAFEPLFSTRGFGTGLGLPTVKLIVEQHGGDMVIGSTPGAGTRVQIRLPIAASKSSQAA
jgi:signal transduction histidine kinase